jgi:hypothetical protein
MSATRIAGGDTQAKAPTAEVAAVDPTETSAKAGVPHQSEVRAHRFKSVHRWLTIFENLNDVFNFRRFHADLGLHGIWVLLICTHLVLKLSKFLVLAICQLFP